MLKSSVTVLPHWSRAVTRTAVVPVTAVAGERAVQRVEVQPRRQVRAVGLLRAIGQESLDLTHATHATIFSTTLGVADLATIMVAQGPRHCRPRGATATGSTFVMSPNKRVSFAAAKNPIHIIFAACNRGRSAANRATNSRSRSAVRITARSIAPATSRPGGRRPALTPLRSPVSSGDKPGSMIGKSITRRVSGRARRRDRLPRHLRVRGSRGPIRLPSAKRTTVERRERDGRPPQCRNGRPALS